VSLFRTSSLICIIYFYVAGRAVGSGERKGGGKVGEERRGANTLLDDDDDDDDKRFHAQYSLILDK
jgi:hypothetical protein